MMRYLNRERPTRTVLKAFDFDRRSSGIRHRLRAIGDGKHAAEVVDADGVQHFHGFGPIGFLG